MNDFLNETLTDIDYKNLTRFNLFLSHTTLDDFEQNVLNLLSDIFGFEHNVFICYSDTGCIDKIYKCNVDQILIDNYISKYTKNTINQLLIKHNFKVDPEQVILLNDILEKDALDSNSIPYGNNYFYDLYLMFNDKGDGIRLLREKNKGSFSAREKEICTYLCKVLSSQYKIIQENRKSKYEIDLFNKNKDNMSFGFMMLTRDFKLINYNKLALCYCNDLTGSYDINNAINEIKKIIDQENSDHLQNNYSNHSAYHKTFNSFIVEIIPSVIINHNNRIDNYYMVYIYNKIWFNRMQNKLNFTKEKYNLTNREKEIVSLVSKGLSNKEIAERLFISIYTVKEHMKNISKKMNVNSRTGIISKLAM